MGDNYDNSYTTMSITSFGPSTLSNEKRKFAREKNPADYSDVAGSHPKPYFDNFLTRPNLYDTSDVKGSNSIILHKQRKGPTDNTLRCDDIEGARAKIRDKFLHTKRHIDPLNPQYDLPTFKSPEPFVTKYIRNPLELSDIDGTQPKRSVVVSLRPINRTDDIEGAQPSWRPRHERVRLESDPKDILGVGDICKRTHRFIDHTSRVVDPVDPSYYVNGMEIKDDLRFTKPKPNPKFVAENNLLKTSDIEGAQPGWRPPNILNPPIELRREFRNTNFIGDIEGAHADTIKHSVKTTRETNPLNPVYRGLDPGVLLKGPTDPLIPANLYTKPTIAARALTSGAAAVRSMRDIAEFDTINLPGAWRPPKPSSQPSTSLQSTSNNIEGGHRVSLDSGRPSSDPGRGVSVAGEEQGLSYGERLHRDEELIKPRSERESEESLKVQFTGNQENKTPSSSKPKVPSLSFKQSSSPATTSRADGNQKMKMSPAEKQRMTDIEAVRNLL